MMLGLIPSFNKTLFNHEMRLDKRASLYLHIKKRVKIRRHNNKPKKFIQVSEPSEDIIQAFHNPKYKLLIQDQWLICPVTNLID